MTFLALEIAPRTERGVYFSISTLRSFRMRFIKVRWALASIIEKSFLYPNLSMSRRKIRTAKA